MVRILTVNFLASTYEVGGAALRGMGFSLTPALLTVFGTCLFRLAWIATVCRLVPTFEMLMNVYPISWVITGAAVLAAYFLRRKQAFAAGERQEPETAGPP